MLFLSATVASCNSVISIPKTGQENAMKTAVVEIQMATSTAITASPTSTQTISLTPTDIPPGNYSNDYAASPGKLEYAKKISRKNYALFPYVSDAQELIGLEYYGCKETNDLGSSFTYDVSTPIEIVNNAFLKYFEKDKWEFVEPVRGVDGVEVEMGVPSISYDVYRISTGDNPAFERLEVVLDDNSQFTGYGMSPTRVRSVLTHVESKEYFSYGFNFLNYPCKMWYAFNTGW